MVRERRIRTVEAEVVIFALIVVNITGILAGAMGLGVVVFRRGAVWMGIVNMGVIVFNDLMLIFNLLRLMGTI